MNTRQQFHLGLVGFGEIGQAFGTALHANGLQHIRAFDPLLTGVDAASSPAAQAMRDCARAAQIRLVESHEELACESQVILSATPGAYTVLAAKALGPHLRAHHLILDLASCTPALKCEAAAIVAESGASFVDGAIVGASSHGLGRRILTSGKAAARCRELLSPWQMNIDVLSGEVGSASAVKILRSIIMKGMEALVMECLLASTRYGITADVVASLESSFQKPFSVLANSLAAGDVIHAARRAEEVEMSAQTLIEVGLDPIVTRAVAERLRWVGRLGLTTHFEGQRPAGYREAIAAIEQALARPGTGSGMGH
jgi:3-hydroxyisobutyrate dehydrogenase-like beta-hydroxyacid dehydrogenase